MNKIKFRAWDEMNKIMHYDFKFIESGVKGNDWIIFISDKYPLENHKTNPFINPNPYFSQQLKKMQFTGLKDKNGKEIYEGDIINTPLNHLFEFGFREGKFGCIDEDYLVTFGNEMEVIKKSGVIGNIYENPELLK